MKIAVPVNNKNDNIISQTFGRAMLFMIYNTETKTKDYVNNTQNLSSTQGAGIQSAQSIIESNASVLITKNCGPKAFRVLEAAKVSIIITESNDIEESIQMYLDGKLSACSQANVEGHWV